MIQGFKLGMDRVRQFSYQLGRGLVVKNLKNKVIWEDVRMWTGVFGCGMLLEFCTDGCFFPCMERLAATKSWRLSPRI